MKKTALSMAFLCHDVSVALVRSYLDNKGVHKEYNSVSKSSVAISQRYTSKLLIKAPSPALIKL